MQAQTKLNTTILAFLLAQQSPVWFTRKISAYDSPSSPLKIAIKDIESTQKGHNLNLRSNQKWKNCMVIKVVGLLKAEISWLAFPTLQTDDDYLNLVQNPSLEFFFCRSVIGKKVCL